MQKCFCPVSSEIHSWPCYTPSSCCTLHFLTWAPLSCQNQMRRYSSLLNSTHLLLDGFFQIRWLIRVCHDWVVDLNGRWWTWICNVVCDTNKPVPCDLVKPLFYCLKICSLVVGCYFFSASMECLGLAAGWRTLFSPTTPLLVMLLTPQGCFPRSADALWIALEHIIAFPNHLEKCLRSQSVQHRPSIHPNNPRMESSNGRGTSQLCCSLSGWLVSQRGS